MPAQGRSWNVGTHVFLIRNLPTFLCLQDATMLHQYREVKVQGCSAFTPCPKRAPACRGRLQDSGVPRVNAKLHVVS